MGEDNINERKNRELKNIVNDEWIVGNNTVRGSGWTGRRGQILFLREGNCTW
jgi:hypothetical protein